MVDQRFLQRVRSVEAREREGLPGAGHGHVVEPAGSVRVLVGIVPVPAAVKHGDVVELQSLGAVRGQQQEPVLAPADVAAPGRQPFDHVIHRHLAAPGLQRVLVDGQSQQVVPGVGRPGFGPLP